MTSNARAAGLFSWLALLGLAVGCAEPAAPVATAPVSAPSNGAASLFAHFKAATGGAAWDAIGTTHYEGTVSTGGLSGPIDTLEDARTGKMFSRFTLGSNPGSRGLRRHAPVGAGPRR